MTDHLANETIRIAHNTRARGAYGCAQSTEGDADNAGGQEAELRHKSDNVKLNKRNHEEPYRNKGLSAVSWRKNAIMAKKPSK
jgi:hypothetical protein